MILFLHILEIQMFFIENVSFANMEKGYHYDPGENWAWISIADIGHHFPQPKFTDYKDCLKLQFMDTDSGTEGCIQDHQVLAIVEFLAEQARNKRNVLVNCHMGQCRSGAAAEAAQILGFEVTDTKRMPNSYVNKLLRYKIMELADQGKFEDIPEVRC